MKVLVAAFASGVLFALGLALGGMTQPSKILGFLDVFGDWDASLAAVMVGAVSVHFAANRWVLRRSRPVFQPNFVLPTRRDIDASLIMGAVLFGVGWGLGGYCPGPAIVSLVGGDSKTWVFFVSLVVGMLSFGAFSAARSRATVPTGRDASARG